MKKYFLIGFMIVFSGFIFQCSDNSIKHSSTKNPDLVTIDLDNLEVGSPILYSELFDSITFVPLEVTPNSLIGKISKIVYHNDTIYILDKSIAKSIFLFDKEGRFIDKINNMGKGPGEYIRISDFCVDRKENTILIIDSSTKKIFSYNKNGIFQRERSLTEDQYSNSIVSDGSDIYINLIPNNNIDKKNQFILKNISMTNDAERNWLEHPLYNRGYTQRDEFNVSSFYNSPNGVRFIPPFSDTIFVIKEKKVSPFIAFTGTGLLTNNDFNEIMQNKSKKSIMNLMDLKNTMKFCGVINYLENSTMSLMSCYYQGGVLYIIYNKARKSIRAAYGLKDDILNLSTSSRGFIEATEKHMIGLQNGGTIEDIVNAKSNNINISTTEMTKLSKENVTDNPILIFYHLKQ